MREVRLRAFAKVNYALDVLGLRGDGYHEVRTVMQSISLADEVGLQRATRGFELISEPVRSWRPRKRGSMVWTRGLSTWK